MSSRSVEVLLLSSARDFATDIICHRLADAGVEFLRLNQEQLPDVRLLLDPVRGQLHCRFGGEEWTVLPDTLKSVWWRQPTFRRDVLSRPIPPDQQLRLSQWPALMRGLMLFEEAAWYNLPAAIYRAEAKPYQLRKAAQFGFNVPPTRITNDRLANIPAALGEQIAIKSVDTIYLVDSDAQHFTYTNAVYWQDCADDDFHLLPATCQTLLSPKLDLRVTVIGERLWCHAITESGEAIEGDWRLRSKGRLEYRPYFLSPELRDRCLSFVSELGLRFAAIDLAQSGERDWFIEVNPTGEWAWLDASGEIAAAIAEELSK